MTVTKVFTRNNHTRKMRWVLLAEDILRNASKEGVTRHPEIPNVFIETTALARSRHGAVR